MNDCEFSLRHYSQTLERASENHIFVLPRDLKSAIPTRPFIALQHDVDWSPEVAAKLAETENALGICSVYFVLLRSPFYNIFESTSFDAIRRILSLGHEVGIHFDASFYSERELPIQEGIVGEIKALEAAFNIQVSAISQHQPSKNGLLSNLAPGLIDYHDPQFISRIPYISDSGGRWRNDKCFCQNLQAECLHVLVHPIHWVYGSMRLEGRINHIATNLVDTLTRYKDREIAVRHDYLRQRELLEGKTANQRSEGISP